ncbi:MAG: hypothetical protein AAFO07_01955 [Bacteroidota bacterium]
MNRNNLPFGLGIGILLPVVGVLLLYLVFGQLDNAGWASSRGLTTSFRERTLTLVAICTNIVPFNYYYKRRMMLSLRGVAIATVILAMVWVIYYGVDLLK